MSRFKITEKDYALLTYLYQLQILSANQIVRLCYKNSSYGYTRTRKLQEKGYLNSTPLVKARKKITQYYYLTSDAIAYLEEKGAVPSESSRTASKNKPSDKYHVQRILSINEIYITLKEHDRQNGIDIWEFIDSRETKRLHSMNRSDLIAGVLRNKKTKQQYGLYVPVGITEHDTISLLASKFKTEMESHAAIRSNIVLVDNPETLEFFRKEIEPSRSELMIMYYDDGIQTIHNFLTHPKQQLLEYFKLSGYDFSHEKIEIENKPFAKYQSDEYFLSELITGDKVMQYFINRFKHDSRQTKKLLLLCLEKEIDYYMAKLQLFDSTSIKLVPFSNKELPALDPEKKYPTGTIKKSEKAQSVSLSFKGGVLKFVSDIPLGLRSEFISTIIKNTAEYKSFMTSNHPGSDRKNNELQTYRLSTKTQKEVSE